MRKEEIGRHFWKHGIISSEIKVQGKSCKLKPRKSPRIWAKKIKEEGMYITHSKRDRDQSYRSNIWIIGVS